MCSFLVWKNAYLNYREFDLEDDLVGVPHTWCLWAQPFITLLKIVWREYDIVAVNEWKKKCVGLQWTWVSKRTVSVKIKVDAINTNPIPPLSNQLGLLRNSRGQANSWHATGFCVPLIMGNGGPLLMRRNYKQITIIHFIIVGKCCPMLNNVFDWGILSQRI